jgi:flagellar motor switch protein FliM
MVSKQQGIRRGDEKPRSIQNHSFRSAGKLSNENARALTAIHEAFARDLAGALDAYLGTRLEVRLQGFDQVPLNEHIASVSPLSYIVPFSYSSGPCSVVLECDIDVVFPIVELLLGGAGGSSNDAREISEIEDEILQEVILLIGRQAEAAWSVPGISLAPGPSIKPSLLGQYCSPNERVTLVKFEIEIGGSVGWFQLVLPAPFTNLLINQLKSGQPKKRVGIRPAPSPIRERILDCKLIVASGLPNMKVAVRDLISLQPGCVLKLRAPIRSPGMLTVEGLEAFEAVPVRNGAQKAAQLGRLVQ